LDCRIPVEKFEIAVQKIAAWERFAQNRLTARHHRAFGAGRSATPNIEPRIVDCEAQLRAKEKSTKKRDAQSLYYARLEVRQLRVQAAQGGRSLKRFVDFRYLATLYVRFRISKTPPVAVGRAISGKTEPTRGIRLWPPLSYAIQLLIDLAYAPLWIPALIVWRNGEEMVDGINISAI
jgi:hypothetical protein